MSPLAIVKTDVLGATCVFRAIGNPRTAGRCWCVTPGCAGASRERGASREKGPNDQGIGWNVLSSLKRVGIGFGLAALVGIPLGFIVGRFKLSEWIVFTKILFPAVLPYMITGVRLSIGVAWLVIVAAEMLTGGVGIGFWVWDEWNNLKVDHIIIAIFTIGIVGLLLEQALVLLAR